MAGGAGVEAAALRAAGAAGARLPGERVGVLEAASPPALGRLVALRFLEWARAHPGGVCCLPTGRTPEHFIAHTRRLLGGWAPGAPAELREELRAAGLDPDDGAPGPRLDSLRFVQMDEFFPVDPAQTNSFRRYVERYYLEGFGMDPAKALLMDAWNLRAGVPPPGAGRGAWAAPGAEEAGAGAGAGAGGAGAQGAGPTGTTSWRSSRGGWRGSGATWARAGRWCRSAGRGARPQGPGTHTTCRLTGGASDRVRTWRGLWGCRWAP